MICLSHYYDFELQGRLGEKIPTNQQQQLQVLLLDLSAIAVGKKGLDPYKNRPGMVHQRS